MHFSNALLYCFPKAKKHVNCLSIIPNASIHPTLNINTLDLYQAQLRMSR